MTIKSDDIQSRQSVFSTIIKNQPLPTPNIPESFKLLIKKLEGACMKINVQYGEENKFISCHEFIEKQLSRDTSFMNNMSESKPSSAPAFKSDTVVVNGWEIKY